MSRFLEYIVNRMFTDWGDLLIEGVDRSQIIKVIELIMSL